MKIPLAPYVILFMIGAGRVAAQTPSNWWEQGTCYEVFVRSYHDSDGDGVGDLRGLTRKLDYINDGSAASQRDLGATCIWLMPVAQSPSYHGYDVTNYYQVNREYGTNEDFRALVAEAHRRGIRIVVDLVLNHMSSEHPIFKSALLDSASVYRDWFLWSPTERRSRGWNVATWHRAPTRGEYYYGLFWQGMPDLNLANPAVTAEWQRVARFWLTEMGVDGFRLDAVGHFFEDGDDPRNGRLVHPWLRDWQAAAERARPGVFTVGEVWDSLGAIRAYYPDQLTSYFAFPFADALINAVRGGSRRALDSVITRFQSDVPRGRWATFQRNHDQTRTMTEFRGDAARARLAVTLLLTMPGIPFLYYGEEIGMTGDKPDPRLRTPMHWNRTAAAGFTRGHPWEPLRPDSFTANVEVMDGDAASLLNHYRRLIHLRSSRAMLGASADYVPLASAADGVLAYLRRDASGTALVIANLTAQPASAAVVSARGALAPGRYRATPLLAEGGPITLVVARDGAMRGWGPLASLPPFATWVMELATR